MKLNTIRRVKRYRLLIKATFFICVLFLPDESGIFSRDLIAEPQSSVIGEAVDDTLAQRWVRWLAREDTVDLPQYLLKNWVQSSADRPTLKEILGWCIEGEEKRKELVNDVTYICRSRIVVFYGDPNDTTSRREVEENVERVYVRSPDQKVIVNLGSREWDTKTNEGKVNVGVEVRTSTGHLANLPFFFKVLDDYSFQILDRKILTDRVIYKISFTPRSEFEPLPEGWFLVDTRDYQIVHGEFRWTRNVPMPMFLKGIDRVVMTRRKHGDVWLPDRVIVNIHLRDIPFISTPELVEVDVRYEDIQLNAGIPDSIFTK